MCAPLDVVILNWNAAEETIRCVRSVQSWVDLCPTVWVVDNASTPESVSAVARACPHANLIRNPANLGFAGGNNRAIAQLLSSDDRLILLLNNDAEVDERSVCRLISTLQAEPRVGIVGPPLYDADAPNRLLSAGGRDIALHVNSHLHAIAGDRPTYEVDYVPGTVVLIRARVFREVGLLDDRYFFGGEIADLCVRARRRGFASVIDRRARAMHALSRSSQIRETLHIYYVFRNRFLYVRKLHRRRCLHLVTFWVAYGAGAALRSRLAGRRARARAIWLGVVDGLRGRWGGQNERVLGASAQGAQEQ
ncbi:MAG: glycosyltransferase family 2 protein [Anaerolineae bacterium]|nr:glycosyltransferase family 2 protein [Anaerolineae bacterium]